MRIFFTGSIIGHKPYASQSPSDKDAEFLLASEQLGYEAGKLGYTILVRNTGSRNVIDHYILKGVSTFCEKHPESYGKIEAYIPSSFFLKIENKLPNLDIKIKSLPNPDGISNSMDPKFGTYIEFLVATSSAVDNCNLVIAMGDGETVRHSVGIASARNIPVLSIATFGGSSQELFEKLQFKYSSIFQDPSTYAVLTNPWRNESAKEIFELAKKLFLKESNNFRHNYFISYAHEISYIADFIELTLLKNNRNVYRDKSFLKAGSHISHTINTMLSKCDTFLAIGSTDYLKSHWCENELILAVEEILPNRIVYLDTDNSPIPIQIRNQLTIKATSRELQELAIYRLIAEE